MMWKKTKRFSQIVACTMLFCASVQGRQKDVPWNHGRLVVSEENRYLKHEDGTPFFWLGDTGWLLPERLNRDEAVFYLRTCEEAGFNVVQVQTINGVPAMNCYGKRSMTETFEMESEGQTETYGYWDHMDYIVRTAEQHGIYIGMVCIWGGLVKNGKMDVAQAKIYGEFLARRYGSSPNIIWIIGGDVQGDVKTEVWEMLACTIKSIDRNHLMTFHPFGRTTSATWFNNAEWLDFNMFQSGHRRYGQSRSGELSAPMKDNAEEDNWRYVEYCLSMSPMKPVIDAEPSYEQIPQGLHDPTEKRWEASDVRRYAYWSVFSGAFGHTYGNNSIMQFYRPGIQPAYGAKKPWWEALKDPGYNQMKYLKRLMLLFPFFERVPDQTLIVGANGERYDRVVATRGVDYLLAYNHTGIRMRIDLTKISGDRKHAWWYDPSNGHLEYLGLYRNGEAVFEYGGWKKGESDRVLIVVDSTRHYLDPSWTEIPAL